MVRKMAVFSMAIVLVFAMVTMASAALNVTSNSQRGSLLVFPKIVAFTDTPDVNTYIFIGNDAARQTWVKCFWMDNNQTAYDFMFLLTPNQPWVFDALTGNLGNLDRDFEVPAFAGIGTLLCFATDADDRTPQDFDFLYGTALIKNGDVNWVYYDAFAFAARDSGYYTYLRADGSEIPRPYGPIPPADAISVQLNLTGDAGYDTCPSYLVANFIPEGADLLGPTSNLPNKPDLTLWPCKQDLRQDRIPTCLKAKFDIWNENEVKFTGAYQCFKCFFEGFLTDIGYPKTDPRTTARRTFMYERGPGYGGDKFSVGVLKTAVARFRVQGIYSSVCVTSENPQGNAVAKTKVIGGAKCPNMPIAGRNERFNLAWGNSNNYITPLLGLILYGAENDGSGLYPAPLTGITPKSGYALHGAGQNANGFIKVDIGGGVAEKGRK